MAARGPRARSRGTTLIELTIALGVLAVAMSATVRVLGWAAAANRAAERRARATQEAANALERLAARPWDALAPGPARGLDLPESARRALPGGTLRAVVADAGSGLRRVRVEVRWAGRAGSDEGPVRLAAWLGRRGRDAR
jgi:type II secretory pathway pseudopilin PulG